MQTLSAAVKAAWQRNLEVNTRLVEHLTPEMLLARTPGGGYSVAQHLAHVVASTKYWGIQLDAERLEPLPDLFDPDSEAFVAEGDPARVLRVLQQTADAALAAADARPQGAEALPHADADAYLVHMMVHDAHHRGQILLALKTGGHPLPAEELLWHPWRS